MVMVCIGCSCGDAVQKWHLQKSAYDDGVRIELRQVLTKFGANLSFPGLRMKLASMHLRMLMAFSTFYNKHEPTNLSIVQASQAAKVGVHQLTSLPDKIGACATFIVHMSHQMSVTHGHLKIPHLCCA